VIMMISLAPVKHYLSGSQLNSPRTQNKTVSYPVALNTLSRQLKALVQSTLGTVTSRCLSLKDWLLLAVLLVWLLLVLLQFGCCWWSCCFSCCWCSCCFGLVINCLSSFCWVKSRGFAHPGRPRFSFMVSKPVSVKVIAKHAV